MPTSAIHMAMQIRDSVAIIAFPVVVLAAVIMFYRGQLQGHAKIIRAIVFMAVIVACIRVYPVAVLGATNCVYSSSHGVATQIEQGMDRWSKSKIDGEDTTFNIAAKFTKAMYKACFSLSSVIRGFLVFFQRVALYILIALSPLLLALMLINETSSLAVKFIMTTIAVVLWGIGFHLTDMMIYSGWDAIMHAAINSPAEVAALGGTGVASSLIAAASISTSLPVLTIGLAFMLVFYFLIGTIVFNILGVYLIMKLLHGGDPISSAMATLTSTSSMINAGVNMGRMGMNMGLSHGGAALGATKAIGGKIVGALSKNGKGRSNV